MGSRVLHIAVVAVVVTTFVSVGLLALAIIGTLRPGNDLAVRRDCMAHVIKSLCNLAEQNRGIPPGTVRDPMGRPLYSWRFSLRPYLESPSREIEFDFSWLATENLAWLIEPQRRFFRLDDRFDALAPIETRVVAMTGPGTAFPDDHAFRGELPADLIMLVEFSDSELAWSQAGDLDVRHVPPSITRGVDGRGFYVAFADVTVWYLDRSVPLGTLQKFFTIEGAQSHDREGELSPFRRNIDEHGGD